MNWRHFFLPSAYIFSFDCWLLHAILIGLKFSSHSLYNFNKKINTTTTVVHHWQYNRIYNYNSVGVLSVMITVTEVRCSSCLHFSHHTESRGCRSDQSVSASARLQSEDKEYQTLTVLHYILLLYIINIIFYMIGSLKSTWFYQWKFFNLSLSQNNIWLLCSLYF